MKYNAISLIRRGGDALQAAGDSATAYALHELANNLLLLMTEQDKLEDFLSCYTAGGAEPLDLDKHLPVPADKPDNYEHLRAELSDDECTIWTCPDCGHSAFKYRGYECDECGFDATDYLPAGD